jgi:response regulator RpfG family c-di-GMP phosphodiesterase
VDDESMNLDLLEALLTPEGYDVLKASEGKRALDIIATEEVDVVLLDVMMPGINGFEVCRRIKDDERYRHIPVVMITAYAARDNRIKGIESGAEDFVSKPFDIMEILARLRMLLKVKDLNGRLNSAYSNITSLISVGEAIVSSFNPLNFDIIAYIDTIVGQLLGSRDDANDKPQQVIVCIPDDGNHWQWFKYAADDPTRIAIGIDMNGMLDQPGNYPRLLFYNEVRLADPVLRRFIDCFATLGVNATNMVCYLSDALCIFALNYARQIIKYDAEVLHSVVAQSLFLNSLSRQVREVEDAFTYTVHALARAAEANDEDTGNHIIRVGEYCALLAEHLGMSATFGDLIRLQSQMHDVGKIHTPPEILKKPGRLTPEEFEEIKKHTVYGARILGDHVRLTLAKSIALNHHERWDGTGYPAGLRGEQIPLEARILSIADTYDALRNKRVYKPACDHETTYRIITEGDGRTMPGHFDPRILQAFRQLSSRFADIYEQFKG